MRKVRLLKLILFQDCRRNEKRNWFVEKSKIELEEITKRRMLPTNKGEKL